MINRKAEEIIDIVKNLPPQVVVTYGDISETVYGRRNAGQAVASAIKRQANFDPATFPWWRVVNARFAPTDYQNGKARQRLEAEGVRFHNGTVDREYHSPNLTIARDTRDG